MITALYSMGEVQGAWFWLSFWILCSVVYFFFSFFSKKYRTRKRRIWSTVLFFPAWVVTDVLWFLFYYPGGEYQNRGMAGGYALLAWPSCLILAAAVSAIFSQKKNQ